MIASIKMTLFLQALVLPSSVAFEVEARELAGLRAPRRHQRRHPRVPNAIEAEGGGALTSWGALTLSFRSDTMRTIVTELKPARLSCSCMRTLQL